jgi:hypothetical protein
MINWEKLYYKHIENCKNQIIEEGKIYHKHHILPKSSGGDDSKDNLITLTYKQHVFAHFILYKWKPTNSNWISYRLMSGINENKKHAVEELKIKNIKKSKNNKKWSPEIIERRRQTMITNIANLSEEEFYKRFIEKMEGPNHPMYGKKRPEELAGNYGKSKGHYLLISPDGNKITFNGIKKLIKHGMNELTIRNWSNKGIIQKNHKCRKPFKWEGFELRFIENLNYGETHKKLKNNK